MSCSLAYSPLMKGTECPLNEEAALSKGCLQDNSQTRAGASRIIYCFEGPQGSGSVFLNVGPL